MSTSDPDHVAIPGWSAVGKRVATLGFNVIAVCGVISLILRATDHLADMSLRDSWLVWILRVPLAIGLALFLLGGLARLAGEVVAGFNTSKTVSVDPPG